VTAGPIRDLGERHGAAGPLLIVALITQAGGAIPTAKPGSFDVVEGRYAALARRVHINTDEARAILATAADVELVELIETEDRRFKVRLLKWSKWHPKDPTAAARQATRRNKTKTKTGTDDADWPEPSSRAVTWR